MAKTIVSGSRTPKLSVAAAAHNAAQPESVTPTNGTPRKRSLKDLGLLIDAGRVFRSAGDRQSLVNNFEVISILTGKIRYYGGPEQDLHYATIAGWTKPLRIIGDLYDPRSWVAAGMGRLAIASQGDFKAYLDHRIGIDGIQTFDPKLNEVMFHGTYADEKGELHVSDKVRFAYGVEECPYADRDLVTGQIEVLELLGSLYQPTDASPKGTAKDYGGYAAQLWLLWILGSAFKALYGFYPHALILGAKESGKTTIAAEQAFALGLEQRGAVNHLATLYRLTKTLANTNLPVVLDEIQRVPAANLPTVINVFNLDYGFSHSSSGQKHLTLGGPAMMLGQDDPFDQDVALRAKLVIIPVDGRCKNPEALKKLQENRGKAPMREWMEFACSYAKKIKVVEEARKKAKELIAALGDAGERTDEVDRTALNYATLLVTAEAAKEFGLKIDLKAILHLVEDLFRNHVTGGDSGAGGNSIGCQFIGDLVDQFQCRGGRDFPNTIADGQLIFNLRRAMDVLRARGCVYDVRSTKGMAEQLRRVGADFRAGYINRVKTRCCVLPLKVIEGLGLDISKLAEAGALQNGSGTVTVPAQSLAAQPVSSNGTLGTLSPALASAPAAATGPSTAPDPQVIAAAAAVKSNGLLNLPGVPLPVYKRTMTTGIEETEFKEKGLAVYAVNPGLRCSHDCTYCSSRATLRRHEFFKAMGLNPRQRGFAVIDPDFVARVAKDAKSIKERGIIQFSATVDPFAAEAEALGIGRGCMEAILAEPDWIIRVLTKNTAVARHFDLCQKYRDRVLLSLSLTATPNEEKIMKVLEPYASTLSERMATLKEADTLGLRTYAMLCPLIGGIADDPAQIADLVAFAHSHNAEEIFVENINPRGNALAETSKTLRDAGYVKESLMVAGLQDTATWSDYVTRLVQNTQAAVHKEYGDCKKLRFLLYADDLLPEDRQRIQDPDGCIKWL